MLNYAIWLKNKREEKKLQQESLAKLAGITAATISRIENNDNDVTFTTAYKICQALSISLPTLLSESNAGYDFKVINGPSTIVGSIKSPSDQLSPSETYNNCLRFEELENFQNSFITNFNSSCEFISTWLNRLSTLIPPNRNDDDSAFTFNPELIRQIFINNSLISLKINYPQNIKKELLDRTYNSLGVMTSLDVGEYINLNRKNSQQSLKLFSIDDESISKSSLSRIESGSVERIRLLDIVELDKRFNENGKLIDMFWNVARFTTQCELKQSLLAKIDNSHDLKKYSILFVTIGRWMQVLSNNDSTWIIEMRKDLESLN
jgi:transcriptional regulator with XRE-family HTH domain